MSAENQKKSEEKTEDYYDQLLRLKAEFENFRKRADREKPDLIQWGKTQILVQLLPLYDVLLKAHEQLRTQKTEKSAGDSAKFIRGMEMIFKEFEKLFESEGVRPIETLGRPLDPLQHEVMGAVEKEELAEGTVVEELQKGFCINGVVLRPARVKIAKKSNPKSDAFEDLGPRT
ncbi:MAG: nucleotide exchange factor GrpE [Elusimicrobia bacterium]|nr:nucleotide exchange factor GrpE [Elusimicrobiota bacterium]